MRSRLFALAALVMGLALLVSSGMATSGVDAAKDTTKLRTSLSGDEEVPGPGDPDGRGRAQIEINVADGTLCFDLFVRNIDPATAAHVHEAPMGVAGPVVVGLTAPSDGRSEGCVAVDPTLLAEIEANPSDYYVTVHNPAFPPGAVRGQLG